MKGLVAFDFDHTIIDDNSDLYVRKLAPGGKLPKQITSLYSKTGWTDYMAAIFKYLHENKTTPEDVVECMKEIPFVDGMKELFQYLSSDTFDVIIISDSNSLFIDTIMTAADLDKVVDSVYTNPAHFNEEGLLKLEYYHTQDWCDLSTVNLCKGHILESHIEKQQQKGVRYDFVAFAGDGTNDLCPSLRLKHPQDLVLPRVGFSLIQKLDCTDMKHKLTGKVVPWSTGLDIMNALETAVEELKAKA